MDHVHTRVDQTVPQGMTATPATRAAVANKTSRAWPRQLMLATLVAAAAGSAQAATTWAMTKSDVPEIREGTHMGVMSDSNQIHVAVSLKVQNRAALDQLTTQIMAGRAAPLSAAEFQQRFAPSADQIQSVVSHLRQAGFTNIEVAPNKLLVTADGSHAAVKAAFKTELHFYAIGARTAYANTAPAQIPGELSDKILAVHGLQTVHLHRKTLVRPNATTQAVQAVSPTQFASIYGASGLPSATNATIAIVTAGNVSQTVTDLRSFASNSGYPAPPVSVVTVGTAGTDTSGTDEWNMDSQVALAAAGGTIKSMLLYAGTDLSDAALTAVYNRIISDNKAKVINVSLGECENDAKTSGIMASNDQIFQTAVAQGQTFSVSSGDSGSYECGGSSNSASYPSVSPYVMSIGGTTLSSSGGSWVGETVWSCTGPSTCPQSASGGTGGGPSLTESAPSWQKASGVLGTSTMRGTPDIAFDAAPSSGALVLINGSNSTIGGTSLAAPIFTGLYSRLQSSRGNSLPFPAQTIYQGAASNPSWFHDVTSGSNGGYSAKAGWDYTTGYGSLNIANFANAFNGGTTGSLTAAFTSSVSGLTVSFTDGSTDTISGASITSHSWAFGDGSTSTATNPSHTYAAAGTYNVTETVGDSGGKSATVSHTVTVSSGATQLLGNSGFETGTASPWTMSTGTLCSNGSSSCSGETSHGGSWYAWLGGYGSTHTDTVSQTVTVPPGATKATLTFYLHIDTAESGTTAYDTLKVQVVSGTTTTTVATYSNANAASGYVLKSIDLSAYVGKTITLKFVSTEDSSLQTSFVLDDINLTAQ
ncbi:MAG: PKD domain-containing protein [Burkholderiales bacterium]|nr:MAG: PKD domain-containing protein [Burkholderiales bacterium]